MCHRTLDRRLLNSRLCHTRCIPIHCGRPGEDRQIGCRAAVGFGVRSPPCDGAHHSDMCQPAQLRGDCPGNVGLVKLAAQREMGTQQRCQNGARAAGAPGAAASGTHISLPANVPSHSFIGWSHNVQGATFRDCMSSRGTAHLASHMIRSRGRGKRLPLVEP